MIERKNEPAENNRCVVRIMGDDYVIRGKDSPEYMAEIAAYIEAQIEQISGKDMKINKAQIAVLTALKIADELHKLRQEYACLDELLEQAR